MRPASFADADSIRQLNLRNGMNTLDPVLWRDRWATYPFAGEFQKIPIGWVLETEDGSIVGNLENVPLLYQLNGQRIKAVVASGWAVDFEHRGKSLQLMRAFLTQRDIDLLLIDSASKATAQVLTAMKIVRIPIPDYGVPCFWAVRHRAFARAALVRRSVPGASVLAWPVGLALLARDVWLRSGRSTPASRVGKLREFDDRFDEFCESLSAVPHRLRAVRSRAVLEWRFRNEFRDGRAVLLAAERGDALLGYAILVRREGSELDMNLYDVADIQAVGDDPSTIRDLLAGSIRIAKREGADALKFVSGTPAKRSQAVALHPHTYSLPVWQLYYKAASSELASKLTEADAWDFSLFDTF
jgi:hypothetical protein